MTEKLSQSGIEDQIEVMATSESFLQVCRKGNGVYPLTNTLGLLMYQVRCINSLQGPSDNFPLTCAPCWSAEGKIKPSNSYGKLLQSMYGKGVGNIFWQGGWNDPTSVISRWPTIQLQRGTAKAPIHQSPCQLTAVWHEQSSPSTRDSGSQL